MFNTLTCSKHLFLLTHDYTLFSIHSLIINIVHTVLWQHYHTGRASTNSWRSSLARQTWVLLLCRLQSLAAWGAFPAKTGKDILFKRALSAVQSKVHVIILYQLRSWMLYTSREQHNTRTHTHAAHTYMSCIATKLKFEQYLAIKFS